MLSLRMLGALMLMFLLCDADSKCLDELTLDPPEVIGEIGESPSVNCTSTDEFHDGMYWRFGNTATDMEDEKSYILKPVSLSTWNVKAECMIKLNESFECSKDLEITIYQNPEAVVMLPTKHLQAAVEGTPYELQCDIRNVAPVQNLTVKWYKDNEIIETDSFASTTKTPMNTSSTLTVNVSRGDHGVQFRCEARLDFGPDGPQTLAKFDTHNISVHYAPELKNNTDYEVFVNEGNNVTLTCEAEGNPSPVFNWMCDGVNILENTANLTITRVNDSATYSCTAANYLGNASKQIDVHVTKATRATAPAVMATPEAFTPRSCPLILTPAEVVVRFRDRASINCSTSATNASGMGWEATIGGTGFKDQSAVTWSVEKLEDWTIVPVCYVTVMNEQCTKYAVITLYKTPDMVLVSALNPGPVEAGKESLLECNIINVAPVQKLKVTWYQGNDTVREEIFNDTTAKPVNVSSFLNVTLSRDHNGALFRCKAELHLGPNGPEFTPTVTSRPYTADVHYKPWMPACPGHYTSVENHFSLDKFPCQADGNPTPTMQWYYQDKLIDASEPLTRAQSGKYTGVAENVLGRCNTSVDITIEYEPSLSCNDHYDVQEDGNPLTLCEPKGLPKPKITWLKDYKEIETPQRWTKHDSGKYILTATNIHGTDSHTLNLNVLYAPVFKEGNYTKEVTPGENVTLHCRAEGNPPPVIHWDFTSAANVISTVTTGGRQANISVTGATSTNAGVYVCVATNSVGKVTRSVTLMMKEKASGTPPAVLWVLLIILIISLAIIIIIIISHKCSKKQGQYTFVPGAKESSDGSIPMSNV